MVSRFAATNAGFGLNFRNLWPIAIGLLLGTVPAKPAQDALALLWEIGKADQQNTEFALAPDKYNQFRDDGLFVVGRSDARQDWPYVHPGPSDGWAGSRQHTFRIAFGVKQAPIAGQCRLSLNLLDTHSQAPPELKITLNSREVRRKLPAGASDASINGQPSTGKPCSFDVLLPASELKSGANEISITTLSGSWFLYDSIRFETPGGVELADVSSTLIASVSSPPVLLQDDGKLLQTVDVVIRHFGENTTAQLLMDNAVTTNITLHAGEHAVEFPVAAVTEPRTFGVSLKLGGQIVARENVTLKPVRKWVVYLLPHSHVDIGYTHVQTDVEKAQWRYLGMAMEAARKSASYPAGSRFKWNTEVLWAVDSYLKRATPEKQQEFLQAVKEGWIGLDALYGNELTGLCRPEELLRLVSLAGKLSARSGVPIESAMITDVPGYTWGVVPAFTHSGVKYFSIGPNGGDRIGHTIAAWGDKPFWWIGPNGRDKVLAWMTGTGYYRVFQSAQMLLDYLAKLDAKHYPYDMVQVRHCLGDNGEPDVNFAATVKAWNDTHAYPRLVIATTAEMFRDFEKRYGAQLPIARGDFTPYWEDGAASSACETSLNRAAADRLTQAETIFAMLHPKLYPPTEFEQAWRNVVLYDEHTWGAHNSISEPDAPFVKSQWAIKQAYAVEADKQSRKLLAEALSAPVAQGQRLEQVDVFNTSSWPRSDLVALPATCVTSGDAVKGPDGHLVPSQRLSTGELVFLAKEIPSFGSKRFHFGMGAGQRGNGCGAQGLALHTSKLEVRLDADTGAITNLRCKGLEADLVDRHASTALNDYFYLPGSDLKDVRRNGPVRIKVKEDGPLIASLVAESVAPGCRSLIREVRVIEGLERVEIIDTVDKQPIRAKEGVHFGFGFNVPRAVLRMDMPWSVVRPELDQIPGACKNWFAVQRWVDISNERYGITWATPDAPLVEVGGLTANLIGSLPDPKVWLDHVEVTPTIYSWAMNNHWHTNYRAEQEGSTVFRYWLWPHKSVGVEAAARFGISSSQPLLVAPARANDISVPRLRVESSTVIVTAFKPSEDGRAWIVRLFETAGKPVRAKITWAAPRPKEIWLSDAREQPNHKLNGQVELPAYGLVTLRADYAEQDR